MSRKFPAMGLALCLTLLPAWATGEGPVPSRGSQSYITPPPAMGEDGAKPQGLEQRLTPEERQGIYRHLQNQSETIYGDHAEIESRRQTLRKRMEDRLQQADSSLSRTEAEENLPGLARHFDEIDLNHDGLITLDEFRAAEEIRRQAYEQLASTENKPQPEPPKDSKPEKKHPKLKKSKKSKPPKESSPASET